MALDNLCAVPGVRVGHAGDPEGLTGCTAVIFDVPAVSGADIARGAATGTRESALLDPLNRIEEVHGILLTGGSAFGLAAADGVMRYLEERGRGVDVGVARVPIVPAAVIFDLGIGSPRARPDAGMGYEAASSARRYDFAQGNAGAGTGATVGKMLGPERAMKGGVGSAAVRLEDGLVVAALVVVNALGDVREPGSGEILAGPRREDGSLADSVELLARAAGRIRAAENTTIGVVATNARLTKAQANKVAQMAQSGVSRAVYPAHTTYDGDAIFAAATGEVEALTDVVGARAAQVVQESILRAVRAAESAAGIPGLASKG
ncbi:P1 family peptidase [Rubrobacter taiwanensis]|uniref:P1 family peptidase n=1 Tax=Rubrobacter taiwanensis TaxID=185139 RepID=UPI001A9DB7B5|nr:P1 family peptidase [Rubrobacter taiwanensis]